LRQIVTLTLILFAVSAGAEPLPSLPRSPDLFVSGFFAASVHRYYGPRNIAAGAHPVPSESAAVYARNVLRRPWGLAFGPDGNLYVANVSGSEPAIAQISGPFSTSPGAWKPFVSAGTFYDLAFGPDGNLYAAGRGAVRRYDIVTGALIDEFTSGYELHETRGIAFGPDGRLYVSNYDGCVAGPAGCTGTRGEIVRFDNLAGEFVDVFVRSGAGGLQWPWKVAFGAGGELLVVNWTESGNNILRFASPLRSRTGRPFVMPRVETPPFISRDDWYPLYIAAGPDGHIYVSSSDSSGSVGDVLRFDGRTGSFIDVFIGSVDGAPRGLAFAPGAR
jgi:DNA-binding beta-propeller fold protein YncE